MGLMAQLLSSRPVTQLTQIQPMKATVQKTWYDAGDHSRQPGVAQGVSIGVSMAMLSAPVYGSTNKNDFIQISGIPPKTPVIGQVAATLGSNAPIGGV